MPKKAQQQDPEENLADNEEFISKDDIDLEVMSSVEDNEHTVWVKFTNFDTEEDADQYAQFLVETLPLLLFETTRLQ